MIMLASRAEGAKKGGQDLFGGMETVVLRNGYGGQVIISFLIFSYLLLCLAVSLGLFAATLSFYTPKLIDQR